MKPRNPVVYERLEVQDSSLRDDSDSSAQKHTPRSWNLPWINQGFSPHRSRRGWRHAFSSSWFNTVADLKAIRWRTLFASIGCRVLPVFATLVLICAIVFMALIKGSYLTGSICLPDGAVRRGSDDYNPWATSEMFTINIGFGKLPFGKVKLIDVIWDTVVGRGGQALLAFISYRISTSALSRIMELQPVSYGTFEAITLQGTSLKAIAKLMRDFAKNESARSKTIVLTVLLSAILVLVFPTLASAMTGYSAMFDVEVRIDNGTSVPANTLQKVWYVIHDGSRLGRGFYDDYPVVDHTADFPVLEDNPGRLTGTNLQAWDKFRSQYMYDCSKYAPGKINTTDQTIVLQNDTEFSNNTDCGILWRISEYTYTYGLLGLNQTSSVFYYGDERNQIPLESPALNISMYPSYQIYSWLHAVSQLFSSQELAWSIMPYGASWLEAMHLLNSSSALTSRTRAIVLNPFTYRNSSGAEMFNASKILSRASCRQQGPGSDLAVQYQWGFSYQPLLLCFFLLLIWTSTIYTMHMDTVLNSRLTLCHRKMGLRRAVLDIAAQYQEDLLETADASMSNDKELKKVLDGGRISYSELMPKTTVTSRMDRIKAWWKAFNVKKWARAEWKWLVLFGVWTILYSLAVGTMQFGSEETLEKFTPLYLVCDPWLGSSILIGISAVLLAGRKHASRWILFVVPAVAYVALHITGVVEIETMH